MFQEIKTTFPKTTKLVGYVLKRIGSAPLGEAWGTLESWMMEAFEELYGASVRLKELPAASDPPSDGKSSNSTDEAQPKEIFLESVF